MTKKTKSKKAKKFVPFPPMTDKALMEFIMGYCDGRIFTSADVPSYGKDIERCTREVETVFLPIALGALAGIPKSYRKNLGIVWEWMNKALPRGINGLPMFPSASIMLTSDWERAREAIKKELERRRSITI